LEARCGGGVEKGPTMDGEWQNKHGEDQQNCKTKKHTKKKREKQYREILKQLQENPTKTKYKGKSKQNKTKETKYSETKENKKQNDQPEKVQAQFGRNTAKEGGDERMVRWGRLKDLPQVEGCETPKAGRPKQGIKTSKNNRKKKGKPEKTKKNQRKR
jgi:hypothetical protein